MRKKLAVLAAAAAILMAVVVARMAPERQRPLSQLQIDELVRKERGGRIKLTERVQLARARGERQITVPAVITNYSLDMPASPEAANQVLPGYTLVVAKLTSQASYMVDDNRIGTWNKFRISRTITQAPPQPPRGAWPPIPEALLPADENDVFVHTSGGVITIEGVEVTQHEASLPAFREGQKYLLALSFDPSTRIGEMTLGLYSVLPVNPDETLDVRRRREYLQEVIETFHDGSLERLGDSLSQRRSR